MYKIQEELCTYCNFCGEKGPLNCYPARTARRGLEGNFPSKDEKKITKFGKTQSAGEQFLERSNPRYKSLRDIIFIPNLLDTPRTVKKAEIGKEPVYVHTNMESKLGDIEVDSPLVIAAMGSTQVANTIGPELGKGAARSGIVYVIGENVYNMWGYDKRERANQPTLKERILSFLENEKGKGAVIIQQNIEDSEAGVWNAIYNDKSLKEYFKAGLIGFEAKGGQGAKPGMGGEVKLKREDAIRLYEKYHFPVDPNKVEQELYQRHSVPGTMTKESMKKLIENMFQKYPEAHVWFKTGPYGDLMTQIQVLNRMSKKYGKKINMTIDGGEGGTGMSPLGPMNDMGLPTLLCLEAIINSKEKGYNNISYTIAGGLFNGRHLAKILSLGADGMAIGKGMLIATYAGIDEFNSGAQGIYNYTIEGITNEAKMLISSLGKYDLDSLREKSFKLSNKETIKNADLLALDKDVSQMLGLLYAYDPKLWHKLLKIRTKRAKRND